MKLIQIPVKPYVRRFIENNYGSPADFGNHPQENALFLRMLKKPCRSYDHKYILEPKKYTNIVMVQISEHSFYRNGSKISKSDTITLGRYFEEKAKMVMRTTVGIYISFGVPLNAAIRKFQKRFKMEDEYWPSDSIIKDFSRHKNCDETDCNDYAYPHIEKLICTNMRNVGILSKAFISDLEKLE